MSFVPQGLPATVTMLLTFAAMRLKDCNVLVKDLTAVDTLGTVTLLASDKTGTLTINRMTVVDMWMNGKLLSTVGREGRQEHGVEEEVGIPCSYNALAAAAIKQLFFARELSAAPNWSHPSLGA